MGSRSEPRLLFDRSEIAAALEKLSEEIASQYRHRCPLLIGILKGSFVFMADLVRFLNFPLEVEFIRVSSYGGGRESSGRVKVVKGLVSPIRDRDVLVVEDIVDTGITLSFLLDYLRKRKPASLKLCSLIDKPSRRRVAVDIDFLGFTVPDRFIVGYGIDFDEKFRYLPDICYLEG
ncbi:MAG: hypoxanthine phosphoribosyltransferase [Dehalococcoidales bacterium]